MAENPQTTTVREQLPASQLDLFANAVGGIATELAAQADYDELISRMRREWPPAPDESSLWMQTWRLQAVGAILSGRRAYDDTELPSFANALHQYSTQWPARGLVTGEVRTYTNEERHTIINGLAAFDNGTNGIHPAYMLANRYGGNGPYGVSAEYSELSAHAHSFLDFLRQDPYNTAGTGSLRQAVESNPNTGLLDGIHHYLRYRLQKLPPYEYTLNVRTNEFRDIATDCREMPGQKLLEQVDIEAEGGQPPFGLTDGDIRLMLAESMPPVALHGGLRIVFRDMAAEELESFSLDDTEPIGMSCTLPDRSSLLVISPGAITRRIPAGDDPAKSNQRRQSLALREIGHELGHVLHSKLPLAALVEWERMTAAVPHPITNYVKLAGKHSRDRRLSESFAEANKLFLFSPYRLMIASGDHFQAMNQLYHNFFPGYRHNLKQVIAQTIEQGRSYYEGKLRMGETAVRSHFLRHEGETHHAAG